MSTNASIINFKYIIAILSFIILGMSAYIVNEKFQKKNQYSAILEKNDSKSLITDLEFLKNKYDESITENVNLSEEVIQESEKIEELITQIKSKNISLKDYSSRLQDIKSKMMLLLDENFKLRKNLIEKNNTQTPLTEIPENIKKVIERNKFLEKQIDELTNSTKNASNLSFINLNATSYKVKNSGKMIASDNAKRANLLVVNFSISENQFAKPGLKQFYFQIIDPQNNVVGETMATTVSGETLLYTFTTKIAYTNKTEDYSQQLPFSSFVKGIYKVNIYDLNKLVGETSFEMN